MNAVQTSAIRPRKAYPNAADRRCRLEKMVDSILMTAICVGIVTILFFIFTSV